MGRSDAPLRRAPQPTAGYLGEVLAALWPAPARARRASRGAPVPAGATELVVLPDARRPKLVVPRRPLAVTAAAVRDSRSTSSARAALALRGVALAARLGAADLVGDRVVVEGADAGITGHLSDRLGQPVLVSLLIGPVRATQKPVLQVLRPDGGTVGFAKVGLTDVSRALVRREGEVLTDLGGRGLRAVRVPRVLHRGTWNGAEVLVQEAFRQHRGTPVDPVRLTAAMVEVARADGVLAEPLAGTKFWQRLRERLVPSATGPAAGREPADGGPARLSAASAAALAAAVHRIEAALATERVPLGGWHGDWAPWNMTVAGGEVQVWDWETYAVGVPLGFDRVHYGLQSAVVFGNVPPALAARQASDRAEAELAPFDVPAGMRRLVVVLYLLHLVAGFLETGEENSRLARLDSWVPAALPVLTERVLADLPTPAGERAR
jgi:hypothetical protein